MRGKDLEVVQAPEQVLVFPKARRSRGSTGDACGPRDLQRVAQFLGGDADVVQGFGGIERPGRFGGCADGLRAIGHARREPGTVQPRSDSGALRSSPTEMAVEAASERLDVERV